MSGTQGGMTRDQVSAAIAEKAWKDETFHKEILADPNAAYAKYLGQPVPEGVTIKVLEDTPSAVHFVIPAKPANGAELSDAELENVAGGVTPTVLSIAATTIFSGGIGLSMSAEITKNNKGW